MKTARRRFLQQAAMVGAAWPFMGAPRTRAAIEEPRRVLVIFSPNGPGVYWGSYNGRDGVVDSPISPTVGTERDFRMHDWWGPLERHKGNGVFFRGVYQAGIPFRPAPYAGVDERSHTHTSIGALTATTANGTGHATGPSIDQYIGQQLQARGVITPKRSLLWGTHNHSRASAPFYESAGRKLAVETNPYRALADLTRHLGGGSPENAAHAMLERKHLVLDHVAQDIRRLRSDLDTDGRLMLDRHLANVEALESSVAASLTAGSTLACEAPASLSALNMDDGYWRSRDSHDDAMAAYTEMLGLAFACDITRVAAISFGAQSERFALPDSYGVPSSEPVDGDANGGAQMHAWHHQMRNPQTLEAMSIFYNWFSEKVATLLDKLKTTLDASGAPLLDSTLVLWTSEFGMGKYAEFDGHSPENVPCMMFGNGAGSFATGRHYEAEGTNAERALVLHKLFVSIIRHAGLTDVDNFGNHPTPTGPLDWLEG